MKIKANFALTEAAGSFIAVPVGNCGVDVNTVVTLNETGAFLWKLLREENDRDGLVSALIGEYGIDRATAEDDADAFISKLKEADLLV